MPEIVDWLLANPARWVPFGFLLVSVLCGVPALWRGWRRGCAVDRERQREVLRPWLETPASVQAAYDGAVLAASDAASQRAAILAAEQAVRAEAARVGHLYGESEGSR